MAVKRDGTLTVLQGQTLTASREVPGVDPKSTSLVAEGSLTITRLGEDGRAVLNRFQIFLGARRLFRNLNKVMVTQHSEYHSIAHLKW